MKLSTVILKPNSRSIGGHTSFSTTIRGQESYDIRYDQNLQMVVVKTDRGEYIIPLTSISHMQASEEVKTPVVQKRKRSKIMKKAEPVREVSA
jgi:hypothetical protein